MREKNFVKIYWVNQKESKGQSIKLELNKNETIKYKIKKWSIYIEEKLHNWIEIQKKNMDKRNEPVSKCRQKNKFPEKNVKEKINIKMKCEQKPVESYSTWRDYTK